MKINKLAAQRAVTFIEGLRHTKGEYAGHNFILTKLQKRDIVVPLFGTLNPDGTRQYRTCFIELPRKNGKTTLAAAIALELTFADGEFGSEVYSAANDRDQAALVFNEAAAMVRQEPGLIKYAKVLDTTKRIIYYSRNSFYRAISAEAYTKWGYNAHGVIYDELHAAPDRELWDVLTTSTGSRRQPLIVVITTAGYDRNSICWELHDYALKVKNGIIEDPTFLPVIYAADEEDDWQDEKVWHKANPALGDFRKIEEMRILATKAKEIPALEMTFRRLYLNQWVNSVERWMPIEKWDACKGEVDLEALKGKPCYAGLDLSSTIDLTALSLVFPKDDSYDVLMRFWIPGDTAKEAERRDRVPYQAWAQQGLIKLTEGNVIDYDYIKEELKKLRESFDIKEIAYDRWGAAKLVQDLTEEGFTVVPFGQGYASMSPPTKELMNLVLGQKIKHNGDPILRWNVDNMVVRTDPAGNLKPDKEKATQKIDGCVAMIMAIDRATRHAEKKPSVYEDRGVVSF
jgi:phage terminase large subunit-like protein